MSKVTTRIKRIELENFKNVEKGEIEFSTSKDEINFNKESEILGLYGQNGSGKTALIDALAMLKDVVSGKTLPYEVFQFIKQGADSLKVKCDFYIENTSDKYMLFYEFELMSTLRFYTANVDASAMLVGESLAYKKCNDGKWTSKKSIFEYSQSTEEYFFEPKRNYNMLVSNNLQAKIDIGVAEKFAEANNTSFLFNEHTIAAFSNNSKFNEYTDLIKTLQDYTGSNLLIINNRQSSSIASNFLMPFNYIFCDSGEVEAGNISFDMNKPSVLSEKQTEIISKLIQQMNIVLEKLIPGMKIEIYNHGSQLLEDGDVGNRIELRSERNGSQIPLRFESAGISKILSILSAFIAAYNNYGVCLVVDELDSGIFEYLLGELLVIFEKSGKGQLIFTSHNFRPMELLNRKSIVFTTTNPLKRYIRMMNVKTNNNLRSLYYRNITIGGQTETLYDETDVYEIGHALRKAGEIQ